ncbi:MAG: hypothetical protein ACLPVY_11090 [Acidimicrobiia bacterium]
MAVAAIWGSHSPEFMPVRVGEDLCGYGDELVGYVVLMRPLTGCGVDRADAIALTGKRTVRLERGA